MKPSTGSHTLVLVSVVKEPDSITETFIVRIQEKRATGGHYLYINIPKAVEKKLQLKKGDFLIIRIKENKLIIKKLGKS